MMQKTVGDGRREEGRFPDAEGWSCYRRRLDLRAPAFRGRSGAEAPQSHFRCGRLVMQKPTFRKHEERNACRGYHQTKMSIISFPDRGRYVPPLRRRKGGSPGRLTSQLLLFRALRPGTSSNKFRHPAGAGPLPAHPFARTPFLLFPPARTYPYPRKAKDARAYSPLRAIVICKR